MELKKKVFLALCVCLVITFALLIARGIRTIGESTEETTEVLFHGDESSNFE